MFGKLYARLINNELITERTIAKSNADKNPFTWNSGTRLETKRIMTALITNVNKPKVRILTGRVSKRSSGRITALRIPSTKAATKAVLKFGTLIPGRI